MMKIVILSLVCLWASSTTAQVYPDCRFTTCQNGGTCMPPMKIEDVETCICPPFVTGGYCQIFQSCQNPETTCLNGGKCTQPSLVDAAVDCDCDGTGHVGPRCENPNKCLSESPCLNNGVCLFDGTSGEITGCDCPTGFSGNFCQNKDVCTLDKPCVNGACSNVFPDSYKCDCSGTNFMGVNCEVLNECKANDPCQNGGVCQHDEGTGKFVKCDCPAGFSGEFCQNKDVCAMEQPCLNGGKCTNVFPNSYTCDCEGTNAFGPHCEIVDKCKMDGNPCLNDGVCVRNDVTGAIDRCDCKEHYFGDLCQNKDVCKADEPCKNSGVCSNVLPNSYACDCSAIPFIGRDCQIPDQCAQGNPCQNRGTCVTDQQDGTASCICVTGFSGEFCQNRDKCGLDKPCQNNGACRNVFPNSFVCDCTNTGFRGPNCEINFDKCNPNPCLNGGTCDMTPLDFFCMCPPGYKGKKCQTKKQPLYTGPTAAPRVTPGCYPNAFCIGKTDGNYERPDGNKECFVSCSGGAASCQCCAFTTLYNPTCDECLDADFSGACPTRAPEVTNKPPVADVDGLCAQYEEQYPTGGYFKNFGDKTDRTFLHCAPSGSSIVYCPGQTYWCTMTESTGFCSHKRQNEDK